MKRLHLLKPDLRSGYLGEKKREPVTYLKIPRNLTLEKLEADIKAGAKQYQGCLKYFSKDVYHSRIIYIEADTREEGLMAVSYMAGVFNHQEDIENGWQEDEMKFDIEDEEELDGLFHTENDVERTEEDDWDEIEQEVFDWFEEREKVPIIEMSDVRSYQYRSNCNLLPIYDGPVGFGAVEEKMDIDPYWTTCTEQDICIEVTRGERFTVGDIELLKRFDSNRHVFLLATRDGNEYDDYGFEMEDLEDFNENFKCELLLEFTAEIIQLDMEEEERKEHYVNLFDNWLEKHELKTEKRFPKRMVVDQIMKVKGKEKSNLMDNILKYAIRKKNLHGILKKEDLLELAIFKTLLKEKKVEKTALQKLQKELVGMEDVKQQVLNIIDVIKFNKMREQMGLPAQNYHNVFMLIGAPGTAKTTVAKIMGGIMKEMRLLSNDRFVCINGAELKGKYVGHSAPKTRKIFEEHDIIFIDEAYSLVSSHNGEMDSFGQEAMAQLMIELEKHSTDRLVMFAGYGGTDVTGRNDKMRDFLNSNPGLRSRINSTIVFSSYSAKEMVEIVHSQAKTMKFDLLRKADQDILEYFKERVKDVNFGNGREARSLIENSILFVAKRVMALPEEKQTKKQMKTILPEDIKSAIAQMQSGLDAQDRKGERQKVVYGFCNSR